jgi:hypothetical protein
MSDVSPGPDWWQASDGKWYPPHLHPDVFHASESPTDAVEPTGAPPAAEPAPEPERVPEPEPEPEAAPEPEPTVFETGPPAEWPVARAPSQPGADATGLPPYIPADVPPREPIDWDRVRAERDARRNAAEARHRRRIVGAALVGIGTLGLLVGVARNRGDDDGGSAEQSSTTTTIEQPSSSGPSSTDQTSTTAAVTTTGPNGETPVSVFELQPGMCVNNPELSAGLITDLIAVPCDQPHSHEVYFKVTYNPPDGAFDAQRVAAFADEQCAQAFTTYVGVPYDRSKYYFLHLAPSAESWKDQGDRDVVCLLFQQGATLTGSAAGSAQ